MRRGFGLQRSKALKFNFYEEKPPHSSLLNSYSLEELRGFCSESDINYSQFLNDPDEKKKLIIALTATYPPDPVRNNHLKLLQLENEISIIEDTIEEQGNKMTLETSCNSNIIQTINSMFCLLLTKLKVVNERISKLLESFSLKEKITYLRNSICVLDDDSQFMLEDEIMLTTMQSERYIDSIRLLTCKYRIMNGNQEWLRIFCVYGGISVLVQNMDNVLQKKRMENTDAATLLELILCLKCMMQADGLNVAIATRGTINTLVQSLRFEFPELATEVLGILSVVCTYGGSEGVIQTGTGFHYFARIRKERPFQILVDALVLENSHIQSAVVALVNALLNANLGLMERISYRNDLQAVKFNEMLDLVLGTVNGEKIKKKELEGQRLSTLERQSSFLLQTPNHFQLGVNLSETSVGPELAEDKETHIHPAEGLMSGICWEAKKSKSGVKRRWYEIKSGVLSWYHLEDREKNINCAPNGSLSMTTVVEVLGYSTSPELQLIFKHCFVLKCSNGLRYEFGVRDRLTRDRWIVAFQASLSKAVMERDAYRLEGRKISDEQLLRMNGELKKQTEIYKGIERTDREILLAYCKFHQQFRSQEVSGYIQHNLSSFGEISSTLETQYFNLLIELLDVSSNSTKAQDLLTKITSVLNPSLPKRKSSKWKNILKLSNYLGPNKSSRNVLEDEQQQQQQTKTETTLNDQEELQPKKVQFQAKVENNLEDDDEDEEDDDDDEEVYSIENIIESSSMRHLPKLPLRPLSTKLTQKGNSSRELGKVRSSVKFSFSAHEKESQLKPIEEEIELPTNPEIASVAIKDTSAIPTSISLPLPPKPVPVSIPEAPKSESKPLSTIEQSTLFNSSKLTQEKPITPQPTPSIEDKKSDVPAAESSIKKRASLLAFFPRKNLAYQEPTEAAFASTKPKIIPEVKMRQFHWIRLKPGDLKETIWNSVEEPSIEDIRPEIISAYQDLDKIRKENQQKTIQKAEEKVKKIQLFDGRRTQNISIIYRKLGRSPDDLATMVIELKKDVLTGEIASTLLPLVLTPDEENIIRGYDGPEEELDIAGRVMKKLVEIPRLKSRLKLYLTILTWGDGARKFLRKVDILEESANELKDPKCQEHLVQIFSWILAIGNYMNGGTNKGQAHGIKLSGLLKLVDCKKNGSRIEHLLHYIIKLVHGSNLSSVSETFYSNWNSVWDAKNISFKQLEVELRELEGSLKEAKEELILLNEELIHPDQTKDPLAIHLEEFVSNSTIIHSNLSLKLSQVRQLIQSVRQFFGENVNDPIEEDPEQVFFQILFDFANYYMRSLKDCVDWMEQKKRSNERALHKLPTFVESNKPDAFKLYEVEQSLTSEDMVNRFKNQIFQRRKTINIEETLDDDEVDDEWD